LGIWLLAFSAVVFGGLSTQPSQAVTPQSAEVQKLINHGLARLAQASHDRLGAKCIIALPFVKTNKPNHPQVLKAVAACQQFMQSGETPGNPLFVDSKSNYDNAVVIILLCELDPKQHRDTIQHYLNMLMEHQKDHGGWGYIDLPSGDVSQTQCAALALWEANRSGFTIAPAAIGQMTDWLLRVQDPDGGWGYQGIVGSTDRSEEQKSQLTKNTDQLRPTMLAAGLSSILISADMMGGMSNYDDTSPDEGLPETLLRGAGTNPAVRPTLYVEDFDDSRLAPAIKAGTDWMDKNYSIEVDAYNEYYLYTLERYKSFQELYDGISAAEPSWYNDGYQYLRKHASPNGGWETGGGGDPDTNTALAVLFLLRSTQTSLRANLGEGMLTGGRGLPTNVANATMRHGQIVVQQTSTQVDDMLAMIDGERGEELDALAQNPGGLVVGQLDQKSARRLQQLVHAPDAEVRLLAVSALARAGQLDQVPTLIYALTDPDKRIVQQARNGLRFTSRRFKGFDLADDFTTKEQYEVVEKWKDWYRALRPDAVFE
jgi:hypothetical protein